MNDDGGGDREPERVQMGDGGGGEGSEHGDGFERDDVGDRLDHLGAADHERLDRAVGTYERGDRCDRATGMSEPGREGQDNEVRRREANDQIKGQHGQVDGEPRDKATLPLLGPPAPGEDPTLREGERVSLSIARDLLEITNATEASMPETWERDFVAGVGDFLRNYIGMQEARTIGADKYFHCTANCEATERGFGGFYAANLISIGREIYDTPHNVYTGRETLRSALIDSFRDLKADYAGQLGAIRGDRCHSACQPFRPPWFK